MQSLEDIPTLFGTAWGIDLISAQLIISIFVIMAAVLPIMIIRIQRGSLNSLNVEILFAFMAMALCVGLGWLHFWIIIVSIVLVAAAAAIFGTEFILGT